ncbi:acyl-CoA dehydrogenase [Pseudomonas sp. TH05]|uniref:acyl-CoA dehydrogenase family protein n=1 Tax=unclassified Pseudomonas TaxID=196821 RepID=UPI0019140B83|nr:MULTISPECIES: acyl-CoA dehydrogenase [unclassified Pseudomonas]MBK5540449.1 acyl-CoA dehydrogenase [Pseudomonas sp. TH07]MBK5555864.1 acyl-CoA dehydrogenase [Pseudomonas sp. TH05]
MLSALAVAAPQDSAELARQVRQFVDERILPHEAELAGEPRQAARRMAEMSAAARAAGLWGSFYPQALGGRVSSLRSYLAVAEQEGRSEYAPAIFGDDATLDLHMLTRHASEDIRRRFLAPLAAGSMVSSYGMSEPDSIGSIPATMSSRAQWVDGHWLLSGRKWFICRAERAALVTVIARTAEGPLEGALSMLLVPSDAPGFGVVRPLSILGRFCGQGELLFDQVKLPPSHVLGQAGQGLALMQERLRLGRVLRSVHWLGLAQRCFDLMCARIHSPRGEQARLGDKQLARQRVFQVYQAIASARALLQDAADKYDAGVANSVEVNIAKVAASQALSMAADSAIQIMGAEGLSELSPLSGIYRTARTTHILDGTDDALISAVGRQLLDNCGEAGLDFDWPSRPAGVPR